MGCACGKPLRRTSRGYAHADKGRGGGAGGGGSGSPVSRSSSLASRRLVTPPAKPDADAEADADEAELSNFGHGEQIKHQKLKPKPYHINSNANGAGAPVALLSDDAEKQRQSQSQSQSHGHGQSQRLRQRQRQHYQSHYAEDSRPRQQQQQQLHAEFGANANLHFRNGRRCVEAEQVAAERRYVEGEQMAAGWPVWLTAVAGEAIHGWIPRRADSFEKLDKIGQGTYSNVYKARDLENGKIVALKKVRFDNLEPDSVRFMAREIQVLRRLDHPNVVKLEGLVTSRMSCSLYLVFEYMEHDLAGLAACPGIKFTEAQVKCYMQQLLKGLDHCHSRGVLHRDIKGSNLLLDNSGILKIADFGLATFFHPDQRQPLTSRVVTLWYRPPELLLGATEYAVAVDLWSTGCILAELLAGKPIMPGRTEVEQLHKIFKLCGSPSEEYWKRSKLPHATIFKPQQPYKRCVSDTFKDYPASALALIEVLLAIEPCNRGTAALALKSEFFTTKPLPCDPASLPKYPPCKEFDAKIRDEEARKRHRVSGARAHHDGGRRAAQESRAVAQESRAVPAPDANAELAVSIQKRRAMMQGPSKSKSEKFNARQDDGAVGFPIEPPRVTHLSSETTGSSEFTHQIGPSQGVPNSKSSSFWTKKQREDDFQGLSSHQSLNTSKSLLVMDLKKQGMSGLQMTEEATHLPGVPAGRSNIAVDAHRECGAVRQNNGIDIAQNSGSYGVREHTEYLKTTERASFQCTASFKGLDDYCPQDQQGTHQRDERVLCKESTVKWSSYASQGDNRMHYSGPLLPPTGNIDAILKEHERHIQHAVRRARQDKGRVQKSNFAQSKKKNLEQNYLNSDSNGHVMFSDYASDMPSTTSNNSFKSKIRVSEEIVELKDSEREPLSSVMESYERECDG